MRPLMPFFVVLLLFALASAGEPTVADGPGLGEMRAAVEARFASKPGPRPATPAALKAEYDLLVAGVEAYHGRLYRDRNHVSLGDLYRDVAKYEKALASYALKRKNDRRDWFVRSGRLDLRIARIRALQGEFEKAADITKEVGHKAEDEWTLRRAKNVRDFVKKMPAARAREKEALDKLEENPADGDARWTLCGVYRSPVPYKYEEVRSLIAMRRLSPEHEQVTGGECEWRLSEGYWRFGMRAEALALVAPFRKKFPKHWATGNGEARWRLAEYLYRMGRHAEAEPLYAGFTDAFPKHWASRDRDDSPPRAIQRLLECRKKVRR